MGDISVGPDYYARVLGGVHDEDGAEPGEAPKSSMEVISEKFAEARAEAMARATRTKKAVKLKFSVHFEETVSFGSGDFARSDPAVSHEVKITKQPPIKGRRTWIDREGNQIGQEPAQTNLRLADEKQKDKKKAG